MGKRSEIEHYRLQRRGGKGVINVKTTPKTGLVVGIKPVVPDDELMVITRNGIVNRQSVDGIRVIGRNTQGVRLVNQVGATASELWERHGRELVPRRSLGLPLGRPGCQRRRSAAAGARGGLLRRHAALRGNDRGLTWR